MRKRLLILALTLPFVGCNSLKKLPGLDSGSHGPASDPVPNHLHGFTIDNHQGFAPFHTEGGVVVKVKRSGEDWHTCNRYEVRVATTGTGGVFLESKQYPTFDSNGKLIYLVITHDPVAPVGTEYDIEEIQ